MGDILDAKGPRVKEGRLRKVMVTLGDRSMTMQTGIGVVGQNVFMAGSGTKVQTTG